MKYFGKALHKDASIKCCYIPKKGPLLEHWKVEACNCCLNKCTSLGAIGKQIYPNGCDSELNQEQNHRVEIWLKWRTTSKNLERGQSKVKGSILGPTFSTGLIVAFLWNLGYVCFFHDGDVWELIIAIN